ncbi:MAG: hypothetical protein VX768_03920, partial [Planctomycetota bacterium]|nr:hypothetical protein [Planctomycetota bacterium]
MKKNPTPSVFLPLGLGLFLVLNATAQKPPELGYVYPPAVTFGKTEVRLGGYDFTGDMQFFVHKEGIQLQVHGPPGPFLLPPPPYWFGEKGRLAALPIPREIRATLTIPPDHPPGPVRWQVANANGSSTTALFYVSDIREVVESRYRTDPQQLKSLPVGVSGRLSRISEIDRYGFRATRSGPITVELFARSLGANFNGVIEVRNQSGKLVADAADTEGTDTGLTFVAEAGQNYRVHLHDVDFRGNRAFVYRLAIRPGPRVVATLPAVGQRGTRREVEWIGLGLASGKPRLESIRREIAFPGTGSPDTLDFLLETSFGTVPHRFPLDSQPQQVRSDSLTPQRLSLPAGVSGRMKRAGAEFVWAAQKGKHYCLAARSQALGG